MRLPRLQHTFLISVQLASVFAWVSFVLYEVSTERFSSPRWLLDGGIGSEPALRIVLSLPSADRAVHAVRVVTERGEESLREAWTVPLVASQQALELPPVLPGKLAIKAAGLDRAGCMVYGGIVETIIPAQPSLTVFHVDLKKLDVPLCN
jgi:hypothetical protein